MVSEGRSFHRYPLDSKKIDIYAFDKSSSLYSKQMSLQDISFSGLSILSPIPLEAQKICLSLGERKIHLFITPTWDQCFGDYYKIGCQVKLLDKNSFFYWSILLRSLEQLQRKKLRKIPRRQDVSV